MKLVVHRLHVMRLAALATLAVAASLAAAGSAARSSPAAAPSKATLQAFAGSWGGHDRGLYITRRGRGIEQVNSGCCCPCLRVTFQLSKPQGSATFAVATATALAVHAPRPRTYAASVPRIGQRGLVQLRNGIIVETLTDTNYCGPHAKLVTSCGA
jgi:hypothetical protein